MKRFIFLTGAALLATTSIASAHEYGYGGTGDIDARRANQEQRIEQGVRSGELTRGEYFRLETEQARIRQLERQAKADGYVSPAERARLRQAQDDASRHIYHEKHDSERRGWRWW